MKAPLKTGFFSLVFLVCVCVSACVKKPCDRFFSQLRSKKKLSIEKQKVLFKKVQDCLEKEPFKSLLLLEELLKQPLHAQDFQTAIEKKLAEHSFYVLKDYHKALHYYTKLLKGPLAPGEQFVFQYQIADSFFQLKKNSQAFLELEKCFFKGMPWEQEKKALLLKLSILISQKNFALALQVLDKKREKASPLEQDFLREYLALVYESQKEFLKAIEELKKIKKPSVWTQQKIKRLRERQSNQPGF